VLGRTSNQNFCSAWEKSYLTDVLMWCLTKFG